MRLKKVPEGKPVLIEWQDAAGGQGWSAIEECDIEPGYCKSVGWIVAKTKKATTIVQSIEHRNQQVGNELTIPQGMIMNVTLLAAPRKRKGKK